MKGSRSGLSINHSRASAVDDDFEGDGFCMRNDLGFIHQMEGQGEPGGG